MKAQREREWADLPQVWATFPFMTQDRRKPDDKKKRLRRINRKSETSSSRNNMLSTWDATLSTNWTLSTKRALRYGKHQLTCLTSEKDRKSECIWVVWSKISTQWANGRPINASHPRLTEVLKSSAKREKKPRLKWSRKEQTKEEPIQFQSNLES